MQAQRISFEGLHVRLDCALRQLSPACRSWPHSLPLALLTRRTGCCAQAESGVEQKWTACREACTADTVPADKYADASICLITVLQPNPNPSPNPSPSPSPSPNPSP